MQQAPTKSRAILKASARNTGFIYPGPFPARSANMLGCSCTQIKFDNGFLQGLCDATQDGEVQRRALRFNLRRPAGP